MKPEKIALSHKKKLDELFRETRCFVSEFSFANLYLFRDVHHHAILRHNGHTAVVGCTYDGNSYIMPTQDLRQTGVEEWRELARSYDFLFPVPEEWLAAFTGYPVSADYSEGDSDYVYTIEKLATYKGQKLHGKKNLLNQFMSLYTPRAVPLTKSIMSDAKAVLDAWQQDVGETKESTDYFPCCEALELYDELVLCGGIYYVDNEPAGFIIGEELNERMFALHFAKGRRQFKGLYQYMYNHFAGIMPKKYEFFNFEQDLGKLALKIAKSSYLPDRMLKKYRVRIKS